MRTKITPRPYQEGPLKSLKLHDMTVLAICPGGGKTEMSILHIDDYIKENPTHRVLILTHSTNVLLDNFFERLDSSEISFTYSNDLSDDSNVHLTIPQNESKIKGEYQLVIVDEAHENYLAARVKRIIKNTKCQKQLLLTGTPSKFIYEGGFHINSVAANQISDEYFAKLNIELVASDYRWAGEYNSDNEVTSTFKYEYADTKKTLDSVLDKLIERLKRGFTAKEFNNPSIITKLKSWVFTYDKLGKTMITCNNIKQANDVGKILKEKGVKVIVSHSENDLNSENINKFKNGEVNVLIVVNRGRLGFNDEKLMNLIDLSGSHNPDIIYQMFCRVLRGGKHMKKFYLKVTPKESYNMAMTHLSVSAALMLTDKKYLELYNGKNFRNFKIPVLKSETKIKNGKTTLVRNGKGNRKLFPEYTHDVIDTFRNIIHDLNNPASIYKLITINEAKERLGLSDTSGLTFEEILISAAGNKVNELNYESVE